MIGRVGRGLSAGWRAFRAARGSGVTPMQAALGAGSGSMFENAKRSDRRGNPPGGVPRDFSLDLTPATRRELMRRARFLMVTSGFVREIVACNSLYSVGTGILAKAATDSEDWNREADRLWRVWCDRAELTGRFNFVELQDLACRALDFDGDVFFLKTRNEFGDARLQVIEAHAIDGTDTENARLVDGVLLDDMGRPVSYRYNAGSASAQNYIDLPAVAVLHIYEPERASAVRGMPAIQHSINNTLDELELLAIEKHGVKTLSDISRVLKTPSGNMDEVTDFMPGAGQGGTAGTDVGDLHRILGGKTVSIRSDEELTAFESQRPSPTFTGFLEHLKRDSSAGVLPYEFVGDASKVGGASVRLIVAKADRRFQVRQRTLINRLIIPAWRYVIGSEIDRGNLDPVSGWARPNVRTPRRVTVDAGREAAQNREDVIAGLKTLEDHYAEQGDDFSEELEQRARNAAAVLAAAQKYNVPVGMLWNPGKGAPIAPAPGNGE